MDFPCLPPVLNLLIIDQVILPNDTENRQISDNISMKQKGITFILEVAKAPGPDILATTLHLHDLDSFSWT